MIRKKRNRKARERGEREKRETGKAQHIIFYAAIA